MRSTLARLGEIRVPGLVEGLHPPAPFMSLTDSVQLLVDFLRNGNGNTTLLTGAGISVDSGIRAYRGKDGTYTIRKHRPIFYGEFINDESMRRRYWARSYLGQSRILKSRRPGFEGDTAQIDTDCTGYPPVRRAESNPTHYAMAALQKMGYVSSIITQNVDGLHHRAFDDDLSAYLSPPSVRQPADAAAALSSPLPPLDPPILELHGTLRHAHCLSCHAPTGRDAFQDRLSQLNPAWHEFQQQVEAGQRQEKLNPDGDIELGPNVRYEDFKVPPCDHCGGPMKPRVIFFGESLEPLTRRQSEHLIQSSSQLLCAGTSLATFSAYRLVRQLKEQGGPVGLVNVGESRADPIVDWRIGWHGGAGDVFPLAVSELVKSETRPQVREQVEKMMKQGKIKRVTSGPATA